MTLSIYALVFLLIGLLLFVSAIRRLKNRQVLSATSRTLFSIVMLSVGALFSALGINLYTYDRLTATQPIADVYIFSAGKNTEGKDLYDVKLKLVSGKTTEYKMTGDGWRLDAKVIIWKPQASLLGFDPVYRLDGIQNWIKNVDQVNRKIVTSYRLSNNAGMDAQNFFNEFKNYLPWLDSAFGHSVYMPFGNRAHYQVSITVKGLIVKSMNKEAEAAREKL